jgi:NitT/TauT family transport system permease protein
MAVVDRPVDEVLADDRLAAELTGLDTLEQRQLATRPPVLRRAWSALWPKLTAIAIFLTLWQLVVWSGWKPDYILPGPTTVIPRFVDELGQGETWDAIGTTLRRAVVGFTLALAIGTLVGLAVSRWRVLRAAVGSMITGIQTMPSIVWFPLAIVLFAKSEAAILFVVVLGASPAIANGVIAGVDHIPPLHLRAGRVLGARGIATYRHIVVPAALPSFVTGTKQGWAFAWRSLLAGELLVIIANQPSIGSRLEFERQFADYPGLIAMMLIVFVIGVIVDAAGFGSLERTLRRRRGLSGP